MRTPLKHPDPFVAGVALYPGCQTDGGSAFYAPLLVLIGRDDNPHGPHTFDMRLPDRTVLGMRLGYDRRQQPTRGGKCSTS